MLVWTSAGSVKFEQKMLTVSWAYETDRGHVKILKKLIL